ERLQRGDDGGDLAVDVGIERAGDLERTALVRGVHGLGIPVEQECAVDEDRYDDRQPEDEKMGAQPELRAAQRRQALDHPCPQPSPPREGFEAPASGHSLPALPCQPCRVTETPALRSAQPRSRTSTLLSTPSIGAGFTPFAATPLTEECGAIRCDTGPGPRLQGRPHGPLR